MEFSLVSLFLSILAIIISAYALSRKNLPPTEAPGNTGMNSRMMQLQAYERLVLLTERISLPNLVHRLNQTGISAVEMKVILSENIRHEFDYNSTQQLYVSPVSWDAVRNLKEQNIMLINQVAASLPMDASASDLNKKILEVVMSQPGGSLHESVLQALNFEAKKLMDKK